MKPTETVKLYSEAEIAALKAAQRSSKDCCGCPACTCGCNGAASGR